MTEAIITGSSSLKLDGNAVITVPASKSHTIRALIIASMAEGTSTLLNPLESADARSCTEACRALGAVISETETDGIPAWVVEGNGGRFPDHPVTIDTGNSGTTLYLAAGIAALAGVPVRFTGDDQIRSRPAEALLSALRDLGATAETEKGNGCAPFTVRGPLSGGRTSIECPTSQYLSALLLCCPLAAGTSEIEVPLLMEKTYAEMTLRWLAEQDISLENEGFHRFVIPGGQRYKAFSKLIPGDFSTAAFFLCAAAITGSEVRLRGLDRTDSQGDKAVLDYLTLMGCSVREKDGDILLAGPSGGRLDAAEIDLNSTPDALPAMAAAACFARGTTRLVNVPQARLKETDRIAVMARELGKMGAAVKELDDGLEITGGPLHPAALDGHGDHRVVMALAVAAAAVDDTSTISGPEAAGVTYPDFFHDFERLAGKYICLQKSERG